MLAQLDPTRGESSVEETAARYRAALASSVRLRAEVEGQDALQFPDELKAYPQLIASETALFRSRRFAEAATEFEAVVERHPTNDFAQFCLGRSLALSGRADAARRHLAIAASLRPDREDYRVYRRRLAS